KRCVPGSTGWTPPVVSPVVVAGPPVVVADGPVLAPVVSTPVDSPVVGIPVVGPAVPGPVVIAAVVVPVSVASVVACVPPPPPLPHATPDREAIATHTRAIVDRLGAMPTP